MNIDEKNSSNKEDMVFSKLGIDDADFPTGCLLASDENLVDNGKEVYDDQKNEGFIGE